LQAMKGGRRRELPYVFAPDKRLLQIVVKMKDTPRAYATILGILGGRVNLIETVTYTVGNKAIFSGFAEALLPSEDPDEIRKLVSESPVVLDCVVTGSSNGILVDTFHTGLETSSGEPLVMFRRNGLTHMFKEAKRLLGDKGETMLFDEGVAMGVSDASEIMESWRPGFMAQGFEILLSLFSAFGWGNATAYDRSDPHRFGIRMDDCFECSSDAKSGRSCAFVRGFLVGSARTLLGREVGCDEVACRFRGDDHCEFLVDSKPEGLQDRLTAR